MGTDFEKRTNTPDAEVTATIRDRRLLLKEIMEKYGFEAKTTSWWHFDIQGWEYMMEALQLQYVKKDNGFMECGPVYIATAC